jgi:hypothetical protein
MEERFFIDFGGKFGRIEAVKWRKDHIPIINCDCYLKDSVMKLMKKKIATNLNLTLKTGVFFVG